MLIFMNYSSTVDRQTYILLNIMHMLENLEQRLPDCFQVFKGSVTCTKLSDILFQQMYYSACFLLF